MTTLSSLPENSTLDKSAPKERSPTKTHHKHASSGAESHHTEAKATHHRPNGPRRSSTYDRHDRTERSHERTHERTHERDGKGSEEPHKRFRLTKLLATPFFLLGGALSAAGGVLFGVGSMVKGFGGGKE